MSFANMKVGTRLAAGFGVLVFLLVAITVLGISRLNQLHDGTELITADRYPRIANAYRIQDGITRSSVIMHQLVIADDPERTRQLLSDMDALRIDVSNRLEQLNRQMQTARAHQRYIELLDARAAFRTGQIGFLKLITEGKKQEATRLLATTITKNQNVYSDKIKGLIDLGEAFMVDANHAADDQYETGTIYMLTLAGLAILLACVLAYWVTRSITKPLQIAVRIARTVAAGDLTSRIEVNSTDETGQLLQELKDMNYSLVTLVGDVRKGADTIATAAREIKELIDDSVQKVDSGSRLVKEAGATMNDIVISVQRVTDIMGEIASASLEQETGIGQINQAISEMDSVTQQNAALVEQAAAAAASLQNQAGGLAQKVSVFRLEEAMAKAAAVPPRLILASINPISSSRRVIGTSKRNNQYLIDDRSRGNGTEGL